MKIRQVKNNLHSKTFSTFRIDTSMIKEDKSSKTARLVSNKVVNANTKSSMSLKMELFIKV